MRSLNEQLLPVESGCEALVVSGCYAGRTVVVHCLVATGGWYVFNGQQGWLNPKLAGHWLCKMNTGSFMACVFAPHQLMRIDGFEVKMRPEGIDRLISKTMSVKINKRVQK